MKYTIDETNKLITFEEGTFPMEEFGNKLLELSKIFPGYSVCIKAATVNIPWTNPWPWTTEPFTPQQPYNPLNPTPYWEPFITYCTSIINEKFPNLVKDDQSSQ